MVVHGGGVGAPLHGGGAVHPEGPVRRWATEHDLTVLTTGPAPFSFLRQCPGCDSLTLGAALTVRNEGIWGGGRDDQNGPPHGGSILRAIILLTSQPREWQQTNTKEKWLKPVYGARENIRTGTAETSLCGGV